MIKVKDIFLTILRNKTTKRTEFRRAAYALSSIIAHEIIAHLPTESITVKTPINTAQGIKLTHDVILVPILRSGITMLPAFLQYFEHAPIGIVGLKRDERTAQAHLYYQNFPPIRAIDNIIILDPMIATGGTGIATITLLKEHNIREDHIYFASLISSQEGITAIKNQFPAVTIITAAQDKELNPQKFIVPGLGDFGDRFFGTNA